MVHLSVALRGEIDDETAAKLAFSARQSSRQGVLLADEQLLSERSSFLGIGLCLDFFELLEHLLVVNLGREAHLEALAVSLSEGRGHVGQRNLLLFSKDVGVVHLVLQDIF